MTVSEESESLIGKIVEGKITNITNFGAFVKFPDGQDGLIHISEIANEFVTDITKFINIGDDVKVKVMSKNNKNKLELSIKKAEDQGSEKEEVFIPKKTKNNDFEDKVTKFMKRSEEKLIDIRRNLKNKQGITKKRK